MAHDSVEVVLVAYTAGEDGVHIDKMTQGRDNKITPQVV